jgi:tight adherence protein C
MLILFFIFAFLTVAALLWSTYALFSREESPLEQRLDDLQMNTLSSAPRAPKRRSAEGGVLGMFLYLVSLVPGGDGWIRDHEKELSQAGIRNRQAVALYALFSVLFFAFLVGGMLYFQRSSPPGQMIGGLAAAAILGYLLPQQILYRLVRRYRRKLQEALPDSVDLLGIVLGTGLALDQSMVRVSEELQNIYPELANELYTVVMQVRAGQERTVAFQQLVRRTGVEDIKSLAAMITQSERFGTSLAQALKVYADALRMRRRLRAEAMVAKAGIKMLFPIVLFILPVLFVITLVPGMLSVIRNMGSIGGAR